MKEEELIKKLESVELPRADLKDHQRQLRAALLARGSRSRRSWRELPGSLVSIVRTWSTVLPAHWEAPQRTRRLAALCALAFMTIVIVLVVTPFLEGQSPAAQAAEIACNSLEVKEALGGEGGKVVRVIEEGETSIVILRCASDAPGSGDLVLASVDMTSKTVTSATLVSTSTSQPGCSDWDALVGGIARSGSDTVFMSTDLELRAISNGALLWSAMSGGEPEAVISDVTGDGSMDLVVSVGPSVRCYDGVTGEGVWRFECGQRRVFENGVGWGGEDLRICGVEVLGAGASQIISVHTDWQVFCVNARNGESLWQFRSSERVRTTAAVPDRDGDGTDELLIGTYEGNLYLVGGSAGKTVWKRDIGAEWVENGELQHGGIVAIEVMDDQGCEAVIGIGDGRVCLIELGVGDIRWERQITYRELSNSVEVWRVPDVTGDDLPDVLVNNGYVKEAVETLTSPDGVGLMIMPLRKVVLLSGVDGSKVWTSQMYTASSAITVINGQPVALELHPQLGLRIVSLKDGQTETSLAIPPLSGIAEKVEVMSDGSYLLFTEDGSLAALSPAGEVRWSYSRLSSAEIETGKFSSDAVPDILVLGEVAGEEGVKQVSVLDGVTKEEVWCCNVAGVDVAGAAGLRGVQVVDDLTGDGIDDIVGWAGETVFRLNGADGSLARLEVWETIVSLQPIDVSAGATGILTGSAEGLTIIDGDGVKLWESAYTDWSTSELGAVQVLNDLNQDGVSELVLSFDDRILVATSIGANPLRFGTFRSIPADDDKSMELKELTNDIDGDGTQEIACFEYDRGASAAGGVLLVFSPASGQVWHQWDMPATVNLACADFDGDGFRDSLIHRQGGFREVPTGSYYGQVYAQTLLEVYSGKDDSILWAYSFDEDRWHAGSEKMPAAPAGDLSGDGVEDLAVSSIVVLSGGVGSATDSDGVTEIRFLHETHVSVYEIASGALLKEIALPQAQKNSQVSSEESHGGYFEPVSGPGDAMRLAGDLNGDGQQELAVLASYLPTGGHCLALVDLQNEQLLGYSALLKTLDFFEGNGDCTVGFTAEGSVCLARVNSGLRVTSPIEGDTVGSRVRIAWEGRADSSSVSVFVDGYENAQTSGNEVVLPLTPGEHEVVVRSVDEYGTVTYAAVHFRAEGAPWASILACLSVMALFLIYFTVRWARVARNRTVRRADS